MLHMLALTRSGFYCQFLRRQKIYSIKCINNQSRNIQLAHNLFKNATIVPKKQSKKPFSRNEFTRLLTLVKPEKWKLTGAVCLLLVSSSVTLAVPYCLGKVIDIIYTADSEKMKINLKNLSQFLIVVFILGGIANFGRVYIMSNISQRITQRLRTMVFSSVVKQEISFFDKNKTGELINRLSADTSLVGQSLSLNISDGLRSIVSSIAGVSMMFYTSQYLAFIGLSIVPPVAALAVVYGRYIKNITKSVQDSLAMATQIAEERIANMRTVRAFAKEDKESLKYDSSIENVLQLAYKESLARGLFFGMTGLSGNFIVLVVLYYGGLMTASSELTVGALSSFLMYAAYVGVSIGGLSSFYSEMMKGLGASTRLWELIDRVPFIPHSGGLIPNFEINGEIVFDNVQFSYASRDEAHIFKNLNLKVPSGSTTAVVGASGSGKSTLAHLLLRFYDPQQGTISVDGLDISEVNPNWLRSQIGTVTQEPVLFSCSIRENILYGSDAENSISEEQLIDVCKEANAYSFIQQFPQKMGTVVGERGILLSGGQKQRIAIARALLRNPKILILDEATSALDAESEFLVQEALERLMKGKTVLTIAHRLSTIKAADQIAVLSDGKIAELGNYETLMSIPNGIFYKLVERQAIDMHK